MAWDNNNLYGTKMLNRVGGNQQMVELEQSGLMHFFTVHRRKQAEILPKVTQGLLCK
jgi:hypothetical protein